MLRLVIGVILAGLLLPASASAGMFSVTNGTIVYDGDAGVDQISGFDTGSSIRFTRFGGVTLGGGPGCRLSPDDQSVDCSKANVSAVVLNLDAGDDVAAVAASVTLPVIFDGGPGNDGLFGGGGVDVFSGGTGNDNVISRDGRAEQVDCGAGHDTAISDDSDTRGSCEEIEGDADGDGVRRPADCNDTNPAIHPGAADPPDDGVDQDCSGTDATNLDADGDGSPRPQDCNDGNPAIHPGAREVAGNAVDENCDTLIVPFAAIDGLVGNLWAPSGSRTVNLKLTAKNFPRGTKIVMRCSGRGCPFKRVTRRVKRSRQTINLHRALRRARLARRARVDVEFSRAGRVGRVLRYRMAAPGVPSVEFKCRQPGGKTQDC